MKPYIFFVIIVILASCHSCNNREHASSQILLISDSLNKASCVSFTSDENNRLVVSWTEIEAENEQKHFYMAFFDELTETLLPRIAIPIEQNAALHEEGMPKLAIKNDGTIIAVYETSAPSEKNRFAGDIKYIISPDKGKSWTAPAYLHQDTTADKSHSFAAITRLADGEIGACWLDASVSKTGKGRPVKFAKTGVANKFGNEQVIDPVACECCRIGISSHPNGRVAIAFRDIINDSIRDLSVAASTNNGQSFSGAVPFSGDGWVIDGCPHNGPSVSLDNKNIYVAWFTGGSGKGVYYGILDDKLQLLNKRLVSGNGRFIQLCSLAEDTRLLVYNESRSEGDRHYNRIVLNKITNGQTYSFEIDGPKSLATYPVIKALSAAKVIVAWSQDDKIYCRVVDVNLINQPVRRVQPAASILTSHPAAIKTVNQKDPVCGMDINGRASVTCSHKGAVVGFCSDICRDRFIKDPTLQEAVKLH